jgi:hypothetical protein
MALSSALTVAASAAAATATVGRSRRSSAKRRQPQNVENLAPAIVARQSARHQRMRTIAASGELSWDGADEIMHME